MKPLSPSYRVDFILSLEIWPCQNKSCSTERQPYTGWQAKKVPAILFWNSVTPVSHAPPSPPLLLYPSNTRKTLSRQRATGAPTVINNWFFSIYPKSGLFGSQNGASGTYFHPFFLAYTTSWSQLGGHIPSYASPQPESLNWLFFVLFPVDRVFRYASLVSQSVIKCTLVL